MKNQTTFARKFGTLYRKVKALHGGDPPVEYEPVTQLVLSFLQWNATSKQADLAYDRLMGGLVDFNDLRVSHPTELIALIGERYPNVEERVLRLLETLHEVYVREYAVKLEHLGEATKKQIRAYLDSLPGIPPYVAAQVTLLGFAGHAVPVDDRLADLLRKSGAVDPDATVLEIGSFLERQVKASDSVEAHGVLRRWSDAGKPIPPASPKRAAGGGSKSKKTAKKTVKKKSKKTAKKR